MARKSLKANPYRMDGSLKSNGKHSLLCKQKDDVIRGVVARKSLKANPYRMDGSLKSNGKHSLLCKQKDDVTLIPLLVLHANDAKQNTIKISFPLFVNLSVCLVRYSTGTLTKPKKCFLNDLFFVVRK